MTEPELLTALTNASVDARAVLAMLAQYAGANTDVSCTLSNGQTITLPGIGKQSNGFTSTFAAMVLQFTQDFGGAVTAQTITRNAFGVIQSVLTTFSSGYTLKHDYTRDSQGLMSTVAVTVKDALGNTVASATKTINRTNGLVSGIS